MKLSADEITVPIDWPLFSSDRANCAGCGERLDAPRYPDETKPHTVLDCLKVFAKRSEMMEARRDS